MLRTLCITILPALTLLAFSTTGCAGFVAKRAHIRAETQKYLFDEDPAAVLTAARELLFTDGYVVTDSGPGALETDWQLSRDGENRTRRLIQVTPTDTGVRLSTMFARQALDNDGHWYGGPPQRDTRFELQVIERLDADAADRIRRGADAARDNARS